MTARNKHFKNFLQYARHKLINHLHFSEFCTKALNDIERFQNQKVVDLKETLMAYAFLQLKIARKVHFITM